MDQSTLVSKGHALVRELDRAKLSPRLAMWVHAPDADTWRLWIVPPKKYRKDDRLDFYRQISKTISEAGDPLSGLDASDIEMVLEDHPAVDGLRKFISMPTLGSAFFSGNTFNGYYLPDGIILRSNL